MGQHFDESFVVVVAAMEFADEFGDLDGEVILGGIPVAVAVGTAAVAVGVLIAAVVSIIATASGLLSRALSVVFVAVVVVRGATSSIFVSLSFVAVFFVGIRAFVVKESATATASARATESRMGCLLYTSPSPRDS